MGLGYLPYMDMNAYLFVEHVGEIFWHINYGSYIGMDLTLKKYHLTLRFVLGTNWLPKKYIEIYIYYT